MTSQPSNATEQWRIPTVVKHEALMDALQPLSDLLGVNVKDIYSDTGLTISDQGIRFDVGAGPLDEKGRAAGLRDEIHPQGLEFAEWRHHCHVEIDAFMR